MFLVDKLGLIWDFTSNCNFYLSFFWETQYKRKRSYTRAYTHPYERTHAHPTPMSTSERLSRQIESWDWRSHHGRLAIDGNVASHWKNIPPLRDTQMSNLGFELWWAGGTTTLLTTQPQVGSRNFYLSQKNWPYIHIPCIVTTANKLSLNFQV
jgi:hypothetical protein